MLAHVGIYVSDTDKSKAFYAKALAPLGYKAGDMPHSEAAANETLALPIYPELGEERIRYVAQSVREFVDVNPLSSATTSAPPWKKFLIGTEPDVDP